MVKSEKKEEVVVPDKDLKDIIPEERGIPLKINEDVVEKIGEIEKLLGGTSIDEEEKREEKISDNDITFVTAEGKKKKYSKK
ncbi:MAG: hypothetical protein LBI53_05035 [Candidatus Peribacteria bacterium]|nr:hypothetical protein [Candidatus Peribacteria bacterium]